MLSAVVVAAAAAAVLLLQLRATFTADSTEDH